MPLAVVAALAVAEAGVLLLRPRDGIVQPAPVRATEYFTPAQIARARDTIQAGGLVVLALPNALSVKGLLTKFTPFKFHVWVTRHLVGRRLAGTEGNPPFPTFMRFSIAPRRLVATAREHGLSPVYSSLFEDNKQQTIRRKLRIDGARWRFIQRAVKVTTLGRIETARAQCILVFQKPPLHT